MAAALLGDFLRARRELVRPDEVGLPGTGRRRVPGLRREEVATLAGLSVEYYTRLEQGRDRRPSADVLDALARVLQLDGEARSYLAALVAPRSGGSGPASGCGEVGPGVRRLLEGLALPAFVLDRHLDVLAANPAADALHGGAMPDNVVRHVFADPTAPRRYPDWDEVAEETVAALRASSAGHLDDERLARLVGELSLHHHHFAELWARHDVRSKTAGTKRIASPTVGLVTVHWQGLAVTGSPGQTLVTYSADPGSASAVALGRLVGLRLAAAPTDG